MSSKYIVRQPIKSAHGAIIGHEILYHGENQAFSTESGPATEFAAANTVYNFLTQNSTKALKGGLNFMTFTTMLLMKKAPRLFDKSELVIQIDDSVIIHPLSMHFVNLYAKEGYRIAVNEFQFAPRYLALIDSVDYIKINLETMTPDAVRNTVEIARSMNKQCIICNVETKEQYDLARSFGPDGMEGAYIAEQFTTVAHSSSYMQSTFFRLMVAVTKEEPDLNEIEQIIAMDASLTYGLLKMVNSAYFALHQRATTIHQAIVTLGLGQLKQWIYLLGATDTENEDNPGAEEFLRRSFLRAHFCSDLMNYAQDMPISKAEAYLLGMFSTLNHLIDAPMEEILSEIPVSEEIKTALLTREGRCGTLYELVLNYEIADWDKIGECAAVLGIPDDVITAIYFRCIDSVNVLWEQLNKVHPRKEQKAQ